MNRKKQNTGGGYFPYGNIQPSEVKPPVHEKKQTEKRKLNLKVLIPVIVAAVFIAGSVIALVVYFNGDNEKPVITEQQAIESGDRKAYVKLYENRFGPGVVIDGLDVSGMDLQEGFDLLQEHFYSIQGDWSLSLTYQGHTFITLNKESIGITYDAAAFNEAVKTAYMIGKSGDVDRDYDALRALEEKPYTVSSSGEGESLLDAYIDIIAEDIDYPPQDAYIESFNPDNNDPFVIVKERSGVCVNREAVKSRILEMAGNGETGALEIWTEPVAPAVTESEVRKSVTLLSEWTTKISSSSSESRNSNIALAFSRINGTILKNGETFSFNALAMTRTSKNGYLEAPAYAYNETVMETGGGVCQASSTLYVAALLADMQIVNRAPHSMQVNYTDYGLDATVNSTGKIIDLKFKNNRGGPVYIACHIQTNGNKKICSVKMYGPAFEDGVSYKVRTEEIQTIPGALMDPEIRKDKDYSHGAFYEEDMVIYKEAKDGHVVVSYLQKWQNGILLEEKQITEDTYPAQPAVWYVGTHKATEPLPEPEE